MQRLPRWHFEGRRTQSLEFGRELWEHLIQFPTGAQSSRSDAFTSQEVLLSIEWKEHLPQRDIFLGPKTLPKQESTQGSRPKANLPMKALYFSIPLFSPLRGGQVSLGQGSILSGTGESNPTPVTTHWRDSVTTNSSPIPPSLNFCLSCRSKTREDPARQPMFIPMHNQRSSASLESSDAGKWDRWGTTALHAGWAGSQLHCQLVCLPPLHGDLSFHCSWGPASLSFSFGWTPSPSLGWVTFTSQEKISVKCSPGLRSPASLKSGVPQEHGPKPIYIYISYSKLNIWFSF